jgi:hypothetical protein
VYYTNDLRRKNGQSEDRFQTHAQAITLRNQETSTDQMMDFISTLAELPLKHLPYPSYMKDKDANQSLPAYIHIEKTDAI